MAGPIPHDAVVRWGRWERLDRAAIRILIASIQRVDMDRLEREQAEAEV